MALNVIGSWPNHAMMLGMPKDTPVKEQFFEFAKRYDAFPVPVKREETAPFHENEITEDINLFDILPLFRINQGTAATIWIKRVSFPAILKIRTISASRMSAFTECR